MHLSRFGLASAILLGIHPFAVASQQTAVGEFEPLVVTATRTAETVDETLAPVTVITRRDIERLQAQSVQDLLRGVPGIAIANNGGPGKVTSLFLRGTESDHVLVLIDGVRVGSVTTGTTPFQYIPIDQVERIEIVRGPRSSLYGSEAIGGVIQIFTRKGGGPLKPSFSIGGGSYGSYDASFAISGGGDQGWFSLDMSTRGTEGFDACEGNLSAGCYADEPDDDGYRNLSASVRAGYRFADGLQVDIHALQSNANSQYDGGFSNKTESIQQMAGMTIRVSPTENWHVALKGGNSRDDAKDFKDSNPVSRYITLRDTFSLQNDIEIGGGQLVTIGGDYRNDRVDSSTAYTVTSRDNRGVFAQYQGRFGINDLQVSLREDDNEQFGKQGTGGISWGLGIRERLRLVASWGRAFKAPTFNELYYPGFGNPDLKPEESQSYELGLRGEVAPGKWGLNLYETTIDNLIAFDSATFAPGNVDEARIRGLEGELQLRLGRWDLRSSLTLLDPKNRSTGNNKGNILPRRARQTLRIDLDREAGRYRFGATLLSVGERYDDLANETKLKAYITLGLRAEYLFGKAWALQARFENLTDEDYQTAAYYNQAGRSFYLTLRYRP